MNTHSDNFVNNAKNPSLVPNEEATPIKELFNILGDELYHLRTAVDLLTESTQPVRPIETFATKEEEEPKGFERPSSESPMEHELKNIIVAIKDERLRLITIHDELRI